MIVVIIIVIALIALIAPGLSRVRRDMRTTRGLTNLKEMTQTIYNYAADNNAELPIGVDEGAGNTEWSLILNAYMTGTGDNYATVGGTGSPKVPDILPIFRDANATFPNLGHLHYSVHPVLMPDKDHINDGDVGWRKYKLAWIKRPAEVALIMDAVQNPSPPGAMVPYSAFATTRRIGSVLLNPSSGPLPTPRFPAYIIYDGSAADNETAINAGSNQDIDANAGNIRWRQYGDTAANFSFPDGHSETIRSDEFKNRNMRADRYD